MQKLNHLRFSSEKVILHVTGFSDADKVIAVNRDPDAALFKYCDFGIVGDMDEVCHIMIEKLGVLNEKY